MFGIKCLLFVNILTKDILFKCCSLIDDSNSIGIYFGFNLISIHFVITFCNYSLANKNLIYLLTLFSNYNRRIFNEVIDCLSRYCNHQAIIYLPEP